MSGGAYDYKYHNIETTYPGEMQDAELNKMIPDLCKVLHDLEWWQSGDTSESDYRQSVDSFKAKWFGQRDGIVKECVRDILQKALEEVELIK